MGEESPMSGRLCCLIAIEKNLMPLECKTEDDHFKELRRKHQKLEESGNDRALWVSDH